MTLHERIQEPRKVNEYNSKRDYPCIQLSTQNLTLYHLYTHTYNNKERKNNKYNNKFEDFVFCTFIKQGA